MNSTAAILPARFVLLAELMKCVIFKGTILPTISYMDRYRYICTFYIFFIAGVNHEDLKELRDMIEILETSMQRLTEEKSSSSERTS